MEKEEKIILQHKLLQRIADAFNEGDFQAKSESYMVKDREVEILRVMNSDREFSDSDEIAEYYFLDTELSSPDVLYFTGIITLAQDIPFDRLYETMTAATIMNANMPFGSYIVNIDAAMLMFRVDGLLNAEHGEDVAFDQASTIASHTIEMSEKFSPVLLQVCEGTISTEELRKILGI